MDSTFIIFGSFFPAWIAALLAGLGFGVALHLVLRGIGLLDAIPLIALFYVLAVILGSAGTWLLFFAAGTVG